MLKEEGSIQRMDLDLRIEYIGLETEICQINKYRYQIYCSNFKGDFKELSDHFDYSIRHIGTNVVLCNVRPKKYLCKIDNIPLSNVVNKFKATCITKRDLDNFIRSRFYHIDIISITIPQVGVNFEIAIEVSKDTEQIHIDKMKEILLNADLGTDKITITLEDDEYSKSSVEGLEYNEKKNNKVKDLENSFDVMHLSFNKELPFMIAEADFWFSKAEDIYTGKVKRNELPFFRDESLKCFLDLSLFDNIDIRNVLLLYDTVYIALPIEEHLDRFLLKQNITLNELIELVDMGKIVILLPNLETRYDRNLLLEVYRRNPNAIVGRRGINSLLSDYLSETKHQYEKRLPGIYKIASDIYMEGVEQKEIDMQNIARLIAWPITAAADSFRYLNQSSPMSLSNFGINNVIYDNFIKNDEKEKISFEFTVNSLSTHIAAALKATYFPFRQWENGIKYSDIAVSNILGDFLNLYWYDADNIKNIKEMRTRGSEDYLKLFECKDNISILKVASLADEYNTHEGFRNILSRLSQMNEGERKDKIKEYNDILFDLGHSNNKTGVFFKFMLGSTGFLPLSYKVSFILSLMGMIKDQSNTLSSIKKQNELKAIEKCIKENRLIPAKQTIDDIYLLDKISTVAILK